MQRPTMTVTTAVTEYAPKSLAELARSTAAACRNPGPGRLICWRLAVHAGGASLRVTVLVAGKAEIIQVAL